jgi:hypothetical protein
MGWKRGVSAPPSQAGNDLSSPLAMVDVRGVVWWGGGVSGGGGDGLDGGDVSMSDGLSVYKR